MSFLHALVLFVIALGGLLTAAAIAVFLARDLIREWHS